MKTTVKLSLIFALIAWFTAIAQSPEEEVLKKLALQETEMFLDGNLEGWRALYSQNTKTTRFYSGNGFYTEQVGWKPIDSLFTLYMSDPFKATINNSNYVIEVADKLAWMVYDQRIVFDNDSLTPTGSKEFRTFIKTGDQWKISSVMTIDTLSYSETTDPQITENLFNATGYNFLTEKKVDEAIEIFKLNVKLYPKSWNVYDSLGEAYAVAGDKAKAIENYQKSIALNPENENGKEWLEKLKK